MKTHIVEQGDTLWKIAKHYGVNFDALKKANKNLTNPDMLLPGQEIQIPLNSGIVETVGHDDHHQKVIMKPSSSNAGNGIHSLKGLVKEVPIQHPKEQVMHPAPMQKEVPLPHIMPTPVKHKEVPLPHTMPTPVIHKEVPLPHTMPTPVKHKEVPLPHTMPGVHKEVPMQPQVKHKEIPMPKKVPIHKEHPIKHIHKEYPIHLEPHFNFSHQVKQIPQQVPQQIKNDIHPEVDIHNNYYLTNMQMIEHKQEPKPKPKPPKKEVHHEVQKHETFTMPLPEVQMPEVQMPVVQNECVPIAYEEFYVQPGCESFYGFGFEPEMIINNQYLGQQQYFDQMQYGWNDNEYMMRDPYYMNPYKGWVTNPYWHNQWWHHGYHPWMHHKGHHHPHVQHHHPHPHIQYPAHHPVHHEQLNAVPVIGKQCNYGFQSHTQNQTQHPYWQQEAIPVIGKSCNCGCHSHQGGTGQMQTY